MGLILCLNNCYILCEDCSRYWECNVAISPAYPACLRECGKGYNHTVLYYDETVKPGKGFILYLYIVYL